jgi:hypothetical protein
VDAADPVHPVELGSIGGIRNALAVSLDGERAYVTGDVGYGDIIDIRDPRQPRRLGRFHTKKAAALDAAGPLLCVADRQEGLVVFDVGDPRRPRRIGVLAREDGFRGVEIHSRHAFLASKGGMAVVDVSDPAAPRLVSDTRDGRMGTVAGEYSYAAAYHGEHNLFVTDIGDLRRPRLTARYNPGRYSYATDTAFRGGLVYLTSLPYLSILRTPVSDQAPRGRVTVAPVVSP